MTEEPAKGARRGLFISFEGTEGTGKSTQIRLLKEKLESCGFRVVTNQEPGTTSIGKGIRRILLDPANQEMDAITELLLMFASRAQAAAEIVRPALERGEVVISDRFTDSTLAYQGYGRGISLPTIQTVHQLVLQGLFPDLTICIVVDVQQGLQRALERNEKGGNAGETRIDEQNLPFHQRVLEGYRQIAATEPNRFRLVDGVGTPATVAERVWEQVQQVLHGAGGLLGNNIRQNDVMRK